MFSQSVIIRLFCLSLSAIAANAGLAYYPQIPLFAASVKSPRVVAAVKSPPPPPAPIVQKPVSFNIEQHELVGVPEPYNFNSEHKDEYGNEQYRRESGDTQGVVRGSYGYTDANGLHRIVDYVADDDGFRATIRTNEPGLNERHPVSGAVQSPADVSLTAEDTPAQVREQIRQQKPRL
ncbi:unnamed protein product [Medioppia subpectinata]|uniref:Cuticle protein n=1 Tax=Medioppia subpectinata TaxID=1979941 RepID=A0A7R9PUX7_9ACAR|nr:unnamed protein product [Medioppia subpectinata]CAG2101264.1 unnamed protein product [Medioppia subpectinata]